MSQRLEVTIARAMLSVSPALARRLAGDAIRDGERTLDPRVQLTLAGQAKTQKSFEDIGVDASRRAYPRLVSTVEREVPALPMRDIRLAFEDTELRVRIHHPAGFERPLPTLLYLHGGGFVIGGLDTHEHLCRRLAHVSGAAVAALDYRLAPEHPFPAAVDDCTRTLDHLREHAANWALDADRFAVGGDSAGGNLSAVISPGAGLRMQLLYYPGSEIENSASRTRFARGFGLDLSTVDWFMAKYHPEGDPTDPRYSPMHGELARAPKTRVVVAGFDILRDEGIALGRALQDAGVSTEIIERSAWTHGFVHMTYLQNIIESLHEDALALGAALFSRE